MKYIIIFYQPENISFEIKLDLKQDGTCEYLHQGTEDEETEVIYSKPP